MKKRNLKLLKLNKKSISNFKFEIEGGKEVPTGSVCPKYCETNDCTGFTYECGAISALGAC